MPNSYADFVGMNWAGPALHSSATVKICISKVTKDFFILYLFLETKGDQNSTDGKVGLQFMAIVRPLNSRSRMGMQSQNGNRKWKVVTSNPSFFLEYITHSVSNYNSLYLYSKSSDLNP